MAYNEVDPISRIEGHLGVKVETPNGVNGETISDAEMHGNLWRGFENFLLGRDVNDAITFVQRICGVCPVPHGMTSTYAVDAVLGYSAGHISFIGDVPEKAVHIRNLVLSAEFLMSNLTHFYHLVVLDYVQGPATPPWTPFFNDGYYHTHLLNPTAAGSTSQSNSAGALPTTTEGFSDSVWDAGVTQYVKALRIRRLTFEAGALFAGRMPMTSCYVGGGVTNDGSEDLTAKADKYKLIMTEVADFIIKEHVPLVLALGALYTDYENTNNGGLGHGGGWGNFLAWGAFPQTGDTLACYGGVYITNDVGTQGSTGMIFQATNKAEVASNFLTAGSGNAMADCLTETIANSRYAISSFDTDNIGAADGKGYPGAVQRTMPDRDAGYSYIKSPRWNDNPCEVGPYARMVVNGYLDPTGAVDYKTGFSTANIGVAGYDAYAKTVAGTPAQTGLDPAMIAPDLAVALVRDGLAQLDIWTGAAWATVDDGTAAGGININTLSYQQIVDAYTNTGAGALGDPVIMDGGAVGASLVTFIYTLTGGLSNMDRIRARALESLCWVQKMIGTYNGGGPTGYLADGWVDDLKSAAGATWAATPPITANSNYGATEAPRGALAHFATINAQAKITAWQAVVPTTWNAGPKDNNSNNGPIEKAIIGCKYNEFGSSNYTSADGTTVKSGEGQLEALRVAHSFDPCIACAIH